MLSVDSVEFFEVWSIFDLLIRALENHPTLTHVDYRVSKVEEIDGMSHKNSRLLLKFVHENLFENLLLHISIEG